MLSLHESEQGRKLQTSYGVDCV